MSDGRLDVGAGPEAHEQVGEPIVIFARVEAGKPGRGERRPVGQRLRVGVRALSGEDDPTDDAEAMRAYAALEQPHLIVQQFRRCETTLRRELSVELSEATVELYQALLADR